MTNIVVDIADMKLAHAESVVEMTTYAFGSCIAVAIFDPVSHIGGMLHYMLPDSSLNPEKARINSYVFADTGIPRLFRAAYAEGAVRSRLLIRLAGGGQHPRPVQLFQHRQAQLPGRAQVALQEQPAHHVATGGRHLGQDDEDEPGQRKSRDPLFQRRGTLSIAFSQNKVPNAESHRSSLLGKRKPGRKRIGKCFRETQIW